GFVAKITLEMISGTTLFVHELAPGVASLPDAHVIGAAIGIATALIGAGRSSEWSARRPRRAGGATAPPLAAPPGEVAGRSTAYADARLLAQFLAERPERTF